MATAVLAEGIGKRFGETHALQRIDLEVPARTVCGLLGPNGAGKTTAVRILSTLLRPNAGRAEVAGFDVVRQARQVRTQIGLTSQHDAIDEVLTGRRNIELFARLHHLSPKQSRVRAAELLEQFGLTEAADRRAGDYSGGMRRRLDLAASFVTKPRVLFLDEPTTGQDPRNRNEVWSVVRELVAGGTTVLLTTHYLDEADQLADQISVIDRGRVIAGGTPQQLKDQLGGEQIDLVLRHASDLPAAADLLGQLAGVGESVIDADHRQVSAPVADRVETLTRALLALEQRRIEVEDVALRRPTLDEVFLRLTGRPAQEPSTATATKEAGA